MIALLLATFVLFSGVAALRHESSVAHVRDVLSGELEHAHALTGFHELSTTPHLHGRNVDDHADAGACTLLAALDQSTILTSSPAAASTVHEAVSVDISLVALEPAALALYLLAPKTSPPAIA